MVTLAVERSKVMSYPCTVCISNLEKDRHKYITYELEYPNKKVEFLEYILPVLQEEYGCGINVEDKLRNVNSESKKTLIKFLKKNNIPDPAHSAPEGKEWLKVTRSKLPEMIAKDLLTKLDGVKFVCRVSLEEEDPDMPRRGVDNFGFIFREHEGTITLDYIVVCEVKASEAKGSPPDVVHVSSDSMFSSLKDLSQLSKRLEKAISKSIDRLSAGEYLELVCNIAESLENGENLEEVKSKMIVVPFMLRKKEYWTEADYGKFRTNDSEFDLATIKYYIMVIDYPLSNFADEVYHELRES